MKCNIAENRFRLAMKCTGRIAFKLELQILEMLMGLLYMLFSLLF